jgi:hypothetical protein
MRVNQSNNYSNFFTQSEFQRNRFVLNCRKRRKIEEKYGEVTFVQGGLTSNDMLITYNP